MLFPLLETRHSPGLVMTIILSEFRPSNLTELDNCNFSNLACLLRFSQMLETIAKLKLNRVRFLTTATNSQIVIVYLGNNDVSEPRKEINSRDSDYCFIIIISPLPFHCDCWDLVLNTCRLQWIVVAAVNAALFMCVVVYLNEFYGGYEVVWWILLNAIYLLGPNNSEHAEYRLEIWARGGGREKMWRTIVQSLTQSSQSVIIILPSFIRHYQWHRSPQSLSDGYTFVRSVLPWCQVCC